MFNNLINSKKSIGLGVLLLLGNIARSQEVIETVTPKSYGFNTDAWVTFVVLLAALVIVAAFFTSMKVVRLMADEMRIARLKEAGKWTEADEQESVEKMEETKVSHEAKAARGGLIAALTDTIPIDREREILTDHDYDGIQELDNNLPPWWVALFYVTTIFGVAYLLWFHVFNFGDLPRVKYEASVEKAALAREAKLSEETISITESTVTQLADEASISSGSKIFSKNCATCHSTNAGGLLGAGPNLTDQYWIHGGDIKDLFKTVKYGVLSKGMIAWKDQLKPIEIQEVTSYILSLQGTNPEGGLEPQGELYEPASEEEAPAPAEEETEVTDEASATALNVITLPYEQQQIEHR